MRWDKDQERKDLYTPVPEKREFDTPSGKTATSYSAEDYFENSPLAKKGAWAASALNDYNYYRKYGSTNPRVPLKGRAVNLQKMEDMQDFAKRKQNEYEDEYDKGWNEFRKNDSEGYGDPDEIDAGIHNAIRNSIIGNNKNIAEWDSDGDSIDDDGNITLSSKFRRRR